MVDETGKDGIRKMGASAKGRARATKPATAATPVLPPVPVDDVPPVLAAPATDDAPAPIVTGPEPVVAATPQADPASTVAETPAPITITPPEPAAPAAPVETKEATMNETVTTFADKAQAQAGAFADKAQEQGRAAFDKSRKVAEDMAEFGKGNVEAMVESARIAAQALETMGQDAAAFARARYESTAQMIQTLASVKSPTEVMQVQADYVRSAFDALVKEASRSTEATLKLAGDVAKPLQNRVATAADKFRTAA